jgi:hypothetical protein
MVFNDGEIYARPARERNFCVLPYVEVKESNTDYTAHTSHSRQRTITVEGKLSLMDRRDDLPTLRDAMVAAFETADLLHLTIGDTVVNGRIREMGFTVTCYGTTAS